MALQDDVRACKAQNQVVNRDLREIRDIMQAKADKTTMMEAIDQELGWKELDMLRADVQRKADNTTLQEVLDKKVDVPECQDLRQVWEELAQKSNQKDLEEALAQDDR